MPHLSRSEQKRISSQRKQPTRKSPRTPYRRDKQEVEEYIKELNSHYRRHASDD